MSSQGTVPVRRPVPIACCLIALAAALLLQFAQYAQASYAKMVARGAGMNTVGAATATNTVSAQNPDGIITFQTSCDALDYPAGDRSLMRIREEEDGGTAMPAQVRQQIGYPFEQGNSSALRLKVMP